MQPECVRCRQLIEPAREILIQEQAFSAGEANHYMHELVSGAKLRALHLVTAQHHELFSQ